jgi:hypothetical protein
VVCSADGPSGTPLYIAHRDPTAWLWMQSEAKRSRPAALPAICDLQGDFQKLQGEPVPCHEI